MQLLFTFVLVKIARSDRPSSTLNRSFATGTYHQKGPADTLIHDASRRTLRPDIGAQNCIVSNCNRPLSSQHTLHAAEIKNLGSQAAVDAIVINRMTHIAQRRQRRPRGPTHQARQSRPMAASTAAPLTAALRIRPRAKSSGGLSQGAGIQRLDIAQFHSQTTC